MNDFLPLSEPVRELIKFSMYTVSPEPDMSESHTIGYRLAFEGGLVLTTFFLCVQRRYWLLFKRPALLMMVTEADDEMRIQKRHYVQLMRYPKHEHDISLSMFLLARYSAANRAVANTLGAGSALS